MRLILPLLLAPLLTGCPSSRDGALPITAETQIQGWAVFDGEVFVGHGEGTATVYSKLTGAILYQVELPGLDKVLVVRRDGSDRVEVPLGGRLPSWARGPFAPGAAERYGIRFQEVVSPEPEPDPEPPTASFKTSPVEGVA